MVSNFSLSCKSNKESQNPYDCTHMWVIKLKATNVQTDKQEFVDTDNSMVVTRGQGWWGSKR